MLPRVFFFSQAISDPVIWRTNGYYFHVNEIVVYWESYAHRTAVFSRLFYQFLIVNVYLNTTMITYKIQVGL